MFAIPENTVTGEATNMFSKAWDFLSGLFTANAGDAFTLSEARCGSTAVLTGGLVAGSMIARKRAADAKDPILKVLF